MSDQNAALFDKLDGFYVTKSEHDWLERRFSNMTEKEKILFQGAMELEKPQEIGHVMRIASQLDCYDLFYGAGDEAALGKFVMESIECSSDAARPFLNAEHLGAAYHQSQNGAFCNGHYVRNIKLADPFVEEDPTLQPVAGDYAIRVKLASRSNMEGIWVGFPDSGEYIDSNHPDELLLGLDSLQAESLSECIALEVDCCLPHLTGILDQYDEEWAAEDNKFRSITSFTASRASLRELRDYLADTLKYARIRAERQIKAGELPGGWFDPKDWDGWQKHMEGLIHRLDGVLALEGSTLELAHPLAPTVPELTM